MPTKSSMQALPSSTDSAIFPARFVVAKVALDLRPQQIFELELIEIRYQQALALMNLQDLFAEGQLDSM